MVRLLPYYRYEGVVASPYKQMHDEAEDRRERDTRSFSTARERMFFPEGV